ncbi:H-NS histone family protein [Burkholderia territorii]|uniref:H-NS histone family protein n=1 Tax=Burkholderia territorii TaxID=1503055 RepID=UPI001E31285F
MDERRFELLEVKRLMVEFGITFKDIRELGITGKRTVLPRYWNLETGATWCGRGRMPGWLVGKTSTNFGCLPKRGDARRRGMPEHMTMN